MKNFIAYNPVKVHFGRDVIKDLGKTVSLYGKKVLLVYGKGSVRRNGIYDNIIRQLHSIDAEISEYSGIKSNPVIDDVYKAVKMAYENKIEVILAVGGGSVIDSAKIISLCVPERLDAWKVVKEEIKPEKSIPVITVLTVAATGTEMNPYAVIQNHETKEKTGVGHKLMYPKHSFLNPQYTVSVPADYTAYGVADMIAHALEAYFGTDESSLSDRFSVAVIKEAMHYAPLLMKDLTNYDYRAKIMWASTCALNGLTSYGKESDWGVHDIGHVLSFLYDIPHGATLSIAYPAWLRHHKSKISSQLKRLGCELFNVSSEDETIKGFEIFFKSIGCPVRLAECGINKSRKNEIVDLLNENKATGYVHEMSEYDHERIVELMFGN